eukprot:1804629-Alexandrium_andersonii.AAC.1
MCIRDRWLSDWTRALRAECVCHGTGRRWLGDTCGVIMANRRRKLGRWDSLAIVCLLPLSRPRPGVGRRSWQMPVGRAVVRPFLPKLGQACTTQALLLLSPLGCP